MKIHEAAAIMPEMSAEEYAELKASIASVGLLQPIMMSGDAILDGRNRARACKELGIEPKTQSFNGGDPVAYVVAMNVHRRHLSESQRSMIAAKIASMKHGGDRSKSPIGDLKTQASAAEMLNVGKRTVERARKVIDHGVPALQHAVEQDKIAVSEASVISGLDEKQQHELVNIESKRERLDKLKAYWTERKKADSAKPVEAPNLNLSSNAATPMDRWYTIESWSKLSAPERKTIINTGFESKAKMNTQETDSIEWARHSLNTITGCRHDCPYCYARDIAERYLKQGFEPSFYPARLSAPANHKIPGEAASDPSYKNIFANSMSDLFGKWVPADWIEATIEMARRNSEWNFLVLTKFPQRAADFDYPDNWWLGATVDAQARINHTEKAFENIKCNTKWLSCEPLLEPLHFERLDLFRWVVVGGASRSNKTPAWNPPFDWLASLYMQAREAHCLVYHKTNCGLVDEMRVREFPWAEPKTKPLPKEFRYLKGMK